MPILGGFAGMWSRLGWSSEALRSYQDRQVSRLVRHAWNNVPYYRRLLDSAGIRPDMIRSVADLARIPITSNRELQRVPFEDRLAKGVNPQKCRLRATSGSTGEPLRLLRTHPEEYLLFGFRLRAQIFSGLRPTDRRVKLSSYPTQLLLPHRLGLFRNSHISMDLEPREIFRQLSVLRPQVIYGIPNVFDLLLGAVPREQLRVLRPKLLFSGAELLSDGTRQELKSTFGCPVIDFYGSHEFNLIAWQCLRCDLYHTVDDSMIVEILRGGLPAALGEEGEVIGTALHSYAMPLIRLEVGDIARRPVQTGGCGMGFGAIERIEGRIVDFLPLTDGTMLNPYRIINQATSLDIIRQFQIVQEAPDRLTLFYVPAYEPTPDAAAEIEANLRPMLPADIQLEIRAVPDIQRTAAGKHRLVRAFRGN